MRKWARRILFVLGSLAAVVAILFAFGLRVVFDGGGGIEGKTWNHPAMSDGLLLIRNIAEMAAFDLRK